MKLFLKILLVTLLIGYLSASLFLFGKDDRQARCSHFFITVTDSTQHSLIQADDLRRYIDEAGLSPIGKSCQLINTEEIERHVRRIDLLRDVQCYHKRNGDVYLQVAQRHPVMRVITDENKSYYLDQDGTSIALDTLYTDYLPLVLGCVDDTLSARDLLPMVQYIASHPFWSAQVEHIYISPQHEINIIPRIGNHTLILGDASQYENKLQRILALYKQVMPRIGWETYDTISVKYNDQVLCTRKDKKYKHPAWKNPHL